ncbi:hypothetical protein BDR22DRAFT_842132, partial [Usnea florida]
MLPWYLVEDCLIDFERGTPHGDLQSTTAHNINLYSIYIQGLKNADLLQFFTALQEL